MLKIWIIEKFRDNCHCTGKVRGAGHSICDLKFNISNEIPVVFHNGSKHDYNFIIVDLPSEFERQCIWENNEKYKTKSVSIKKKIAKIDKEINETVESITHKIKFIDSMRFMASLFPNFVDNLTEEIHKINCKNPDCFFFIWKCQGQFNKI